MGAVDASELYRARDARQAWARLLPDLGLPGADASVGELFGAFGHHMRNAIRESLGADVRAAKNVRRLQQWAADPHPATAEDGKKALERAGGVRAEVLADAVEHRMNVIGRGVALAAGAPDQLLALTADAIEPAQYPMPALRVMHRTLNHDGVRQSLGLHGARRADLPAAHGHGLNGVTPDVPVPESRLRDEKLRRRRRR